MQGSYYVLAYNSSIVPLINIIQPMLLYVWYLILEYCQSLRWGSKAVLMLPVAAGCSSAGLLLSLAMKWMANSCFRTLVVILLSMVQVNQLPPCCNWNTRICSLREELIPKQFFCYIYNVCIREYTCIDHVNVFVIGSIGVLLDSVEKQ